MKILAAERCADVHCLAQLAGKLLWFVLHSFAISAPADPPCQAYRVDLGVHKSPGTLHSSRLLPIGLRRPEIFVLAVVALLSVWDWPRRTAVSACI